eukprot:1990594-Alexandrium_andersonii.AAC.1
MNLPAAECHQTKTWFKRRKLQPQQVSKHATLKREPPITVGRVLHAEITVTSRLVHHVLNSYEQHRK